MGRYARFTLRLLTIAIAIVGVFGALRVAQAGAMPTAALAPRVSAPIDAPRARPTPTLPFSASPSPSPRSVSVRHRSVLWTRNTMLKKPANAPKLSQFLVKTGRNTWNVRHVASAQRPLDAGTRRVLPQDAAGQTILLTGDATNYFANDITLEYGADVYLECQNMLKTNYANYEYVIFPPDGGAAQTAAAGTTTANGDCPDYANFTLATPFGTDTAQPYPGVWIVAMEDKTSGAYVTETAIIAEAALNFTTYANLGLTTPTYDFAPGSSIVVNATGLNSSQSYAIGWVLTAGTGLPCEFAIPAKTTANGVCFRGVATGVQAFGSQLTQEWYSASSPSTSTAPTGTYDVELYDTTSSEMIGHQQMSIEPSTVAWTLTPYYTGVPAATPPPGFNYTSIYATDGLLDQSVTGIGYGATGLPASVNGHKLSIVVSDPNGVALTNVVQYEPGSAQLTTSPQPSSPAIAGATLNSQNVAFPLNATYETALGPTQTAFAPNVLTAQLYDQTAGAVVASKSFQLLGYYSTFAWSTNTLLNAGPAGTVGTVVITNTAGTNYGSWNGDAISGVQIASVPANGESLSVSSTTATDSGGNAWTITSTGTGVNTVIIATPNQRNVGIPVGGTLSFNVEVTIPSADCATPCNLPTQILPEHGIAYSAADAASTQLQVLQNGVPPSSVVPTISWSVQSETATANMAARAATNGNVFDQLTYILGTANSPNTDTYTINLTLNNKVSPGGEKLTEVKLTFPAAVDFNATGESPTYTGPVGTGTWGTPALTNTSGPLGGDGQNVIALDCKETANNGCGIPEGSSGTFILKFKLFSTSFAMTDIAAEANFDDGSSYGSCTCTLTPYALSPTSTTVNGVAGLTNVDSSMLGAFSLNPTLMSAVFTPSTVGTGAATSATLTFTNTPTTRDPNPDYVDQFNLKFPNTNGLNPTSITGLPTGWVATQTTTDNWLIGLCAAPTPTVPCSTNETADAIAPGGQLQMTLNYNAPGPTAGTYATSIQWWATGANGGESTSAITEYAPITFSTTTASAAFTSINGVTVPGGTEPQSSDDSQYVAAKNLYGTKYVYLVTNTGSTAINEVQVVVPYQTRSGAAGEDGATANAGYFDILSATAAYSGGASGCGAATIVQPTTTANGTITFTGCTVPADGGAVAVTFYAQTPYLIGNEFTFPANVFSGATEVAAQSTYTAANTLSIVLGGGISILTPAVGWVAPTQPNSVTAAPLSGANPQTSCVSCQVFAGTPTVLDFGYFNGSFSFTDVLDASVTSDANSLSSNSWVLYVTTSPGTNPATNLLSTAVDQPNSSSVTNFTINQTTETAVLTTTPGLQLGTYANAAPYHKPIDSVMDFNVNTNGTNAAGTVTLTYTLVFN